MTRINCVPVSELRGKHLIAEYHELPRIYGLVRKAIARGEKPNLTYPYEYNLGKGHMRFFYPRLGYLNQRFEELVTEMKSRGYKPSYSSPPLEGIPSEWFNDWIPDRRSIRLNRFRLLERNGGL